MEVVRSQTKGFATRSAPRACNNGRALKYLCDGIGGEDNKYKAFRPYSNIGLTGCPVKVLRAK